MNHNELTGCIPPALQPFASSINPQRNNVILPVCSVTLSLSPDTVSEGASAVDITVTASIGGTALPADTTVRVTRTGGTATPGTDYPAISAFTVTIAAGDTTGTATLSFNPTADNVAEGGETVILTGALSGFTSGTATLTIADNTAPTASAAMVTTDEDTDHTFAASEFNYSDTDGDTLASVSIATLPASGRGTLTLSGAAVSANDVVTKTQLDAGNLKYSPPTNANRTAYASFTFKVSDGKQESASAYTMTINVTPVNDPATGRPSISGTPRVGDTLTAVTTAIADVEGVPSTLSYQWKRYAADGSTFEADLGTDSAQALAASEAGKRIRVEVSFTDNAGTAEGPLASDAFPSSGTVQDTSTSNTAPTASAATVTTDEDTDHTFAASEFNYSDTDNDTLASVTIATLPASGRGTLTLSGAAVSANDVVTKAQIDAGNLKYEPPLNANGTAYASFTFRVSDGTEVSASAYTMTINVTPVNDPATGRPSISGTALVGQTLTAVTTAIADADGKPSTFSYQWKRYAADGSTFEAVLGTDPAQALAASEAGKRIRVEVSFTDNAGTAEGPLTSDAFPSSGTVQDNNTDTRAPELTGATVNASTLVLTYDEPLDAFSEPAPGAFTVTAAGNSITVMQVDVGGSAVTLTLWGVVHGHQAVTLDYTPGTNPIQDEAGNDAAALAGHSVTNDTPPIATIEPHNPEVAEDAGNVVLTIVLDRSPDSPLPVEWYTVNQTAEAPEDYVARHDETVTFAVGENRKTISVAIVDDAVHEGLVNGLHESFLVSLAEGPGYRFLPAGESSFTLVWIVDDDPRDGTPPALVRAAVNAATLVLTYDKALDGASRPAGGDFTVTAAGSTVGVSRVRIGGSSVTLTLASAVQGGQAVALDYTPGANPIRDEAGNNAAALSGRSVTNDTDSRPPELTGATVHGRTLVLAYDEALDARRESRPAKGDFTVTAAGSTIGVNSVDIAGSSVTLYLASAVEPGQTVTLDYTPGANPIRDEAGNNAAALSGQSVTNTTVVASIDPAYLMVSEGAGNAVMTVSLDRPAPAPLSVAWHTQDQDATAPDDYTARETTVNFRRGEDRKTISVPIVDDTLPEPPVNNVHEIFWVILDDGDGYTTAGATFATMVEIVDNDSGSGSASADAANDDLALLDDLTPDAATQALMGEQSLGEDQLAALDRLGNRNGRYDLGDLLSWIDRCRRGEARCGQASSGSGAAASSALLPLGAAAAGRRRGSRRAGGRRTSGRRRARTVLAALLAATAWSCTGDLVGPPGVERDSGAPAAGLPMPANAPRGPGFLTVEWAAPTSGRATGALLELEGPAIDSVQAPGLELYHASADGRHRIVVAGDLGAGALVKFQVPDRGRISAYRVRVLQVTGEDYGLRDPTEWRAVISPP